MDIGDVLPCTSHSGTVRHTCPIKMEQGTGSFLLSEKTKLYTNLQGGEAELWENYLKALPVQLKEARMKDRKQMLFLLITPKTPQLPSPESYTLSVTSQRIEIRATSGAGLFYGMQTLLQLMQPASTGSYSVPSVEIEDTPRFAYRGLMLDVSRHFSTKEFIKKQIDALAYYKINRLHLHLTDAAGWRLEIKKYPLLTDFAAGVQTPPGRNGGTADVNTSVTMNPELPAAITPRTIFVKYWNMPVSITSR